jgi:hypothetical protein
MSDTLLQVLLLPMGVLMYASGLLFWPIRRWVRRNKVRGKWLGFVFLAQVVSYVIVACSSAFIQLGHYYYWFIFLIELNVVFTLAAVVAWAHDACYERRLEASHDA